MIRNGLQTNYVNVTASLQTKGGVYYAVLSYKDISGNWKTKWKSLGIREESGNKRIAKEKAEICKREFENSMCENLSLKSTELGSQLDMEFIDFMNRRLEEVRVKRKYEYDTYAAYKANINTRMKEFFGSSKLELDENGKEIAPTHKQHIYKVEDITPELIDDFFTYLSVKCNLKNTTIKHFKNIISVAFEMLDKKNIMKNPTKGIEPLKEEVFTPETYNMNELNQLLKIVKNDIIEIPVLLASYYGLRRSEVVGLKWSAIDFDNDYIEINHTVIEVSGCGNKIVEGKLIAKDRTKSIYSNRQLPLYKDLKEVLQEKKRQIELNRQLLKNGYNQKYLDYVCVKDNGDLIKPNHITHRFLKLIRRNGLKEIRFHDLRHTLATELNANGIDLKSIGEFLGHGNLSTTKRYAHPDARIKQNVLDTYMNLINTAKEKENEKKDEKKPKRFFIKRKIVSKMAN